MEVCDVRDMRRVWRKASKSVKFVKSLNTYHYGYDVDSEGIKYMQITYPDGRVYAYKNTRVSGYGYGRKALRSE